MATKSTTDRKAELASQIATAASGDRVREMLAVLTEMDRQGVARASYNLDSPYGRGVFRCEADEED